MNTKFMSRYADLFLLITAVVWGSGFIFVKLALDNGITSLYVMTIRFMVACILLGIIFYKKFKTISKTDLKNGGILGIFLFLGFYTQTVGLVYTTPSKNAFLTSVNVVFVPFLYWIINKKRPETKIFVSIILSMIGVYLLSMNGSFSLELGDTLSLMCAFFFAFQIALSGRYSKETDPILLTIIQLSVAAILSILFALTFEEFPKNANFLGIFSGIYLGIFCTMIAFLIQMTAQKYTASTKVAIILSTEALFGTIFSVIFLKEILTNKMLMGCVLIFLAVIITEVKFNIFKLDLRKKLIPKLRKKYN